MEERIEVRYAYLFWAGEHIYHKYIVYTDINGVEWYARGGTESKISGLFPDNHPLQPFGNILTQYGEYLQGTPDYISPSVGSHPSEIITSGEDLSAQWSAIKGAMDNINSENHIYNPGGYAGRNSNSAVDTALHRAGLPQPMLDDRGAYLSPGSGHILPTSPATISGATGDISEGIVEVIGKFQISGERGSPLIFDLNNSGTIDLISLADSTAYWDNNVNGFRSVSGWVSSGDGLLAMDHNQNGMIDNNAELFGTMTMDGFAVLGLYDSNQDGIISAEDHVWDDLIIWQDHNENGFSEEGELYSLSHFGIVSISLNSTSVSLTNHGHHVSHTGTYTVDTGSGLESRIVHDVWFNFDLVNTRFYSNVDLDINALLLPVDLRGYGTLPDLHIAMSLDNNGTGNLLDLVSGFHDQTIDEIFDSSTTADAVRAIMFRWAGVDGVSPTSRGKFVDGQELAFLEALMGQGFLQQGYARNPLWVRPAGVDETGTSGNDTMNGSTGDDRLEGGNGDDILVGGAGPCDFGDSQGHKCTLQPQGAKQESYHDNIVRFTHEMRGRISSYTNDNVEVLRVAV